MAGSQLNRWIVTATPTIRLATQRLVAAAGGDAHGCSNDALWVQSYPTPAKAGLILVALVLLGVIVGKVITVLGHSEIRTHTNRENGGRVTLDVGVAELRGSLP